MAEGAAVGPDGLEHGQAARARMAVLLAVTVLALLSDGFDLAAIGYVGPELVKEWRVSPAALAPAFSAGIFGLLVGAPLFGFVGDRFGRRTAILAGLCLFGSLSLATAAAPSLPALVAEAAPRRLRGRLIVVANFGIPLGFSLPGLVAAALVPRFGWQVLLLAGGALPLAVALLAWRTLPESAEFLAARGRMADPQAPRAGSPRALFSGGLAAITPLLWFALAANQMANFFSLMWLPTLLQSAGLGTSQAGVGGSLFSLGGLAGGACPAAVVDRLGVVPLVILFCAGAPLVAAIGWPDLSAAAHGAVIAGAGFCVTGINFGMNATMGTIYPTPVRSAGTGWGQAAGRVGALAAPVAGGALLGLGLPTQDLLLTPALVLGAGGVACALLATLCIRRFGGVRIGEHPAEAAPRPAPAALRRLAPDAE